MDAYPDAQWNIGHVPDLELSTFTEKIQGHSRDFPCVSVSVSDWKATARHVSVSDRLDLKNYLYLT